MKTVFLRILLCLVLVEGRRGLRCNDGSQPSSCTCPDGTSHAPYTTGDCGSSVAPTYCTCTYNCNCTYTVTYKHKPVRSGESKSGRLKGIPHVLSPDLLHNLMSMGHGDLIVLADDNFPAASTARAGPREVRADGHAIPELLEAIMKFFPLNTHDDAPVMFMEPVPEDKKKGTPHVWEVYKDIINEAEQRQVPVKQIERFKFYEVAKTAYAVVATGEKAAYGNVILQKGIVL